jgi:hypothetical protein
MSDRRLAAVNQAELLTTVIWRAGRAASEALKHGSSGIVIEQAAFLLNIAEYLPPGRHRKLALDLANAALRDAWQSRIDHPDKLRLFQRWARLAGTQFPAPPLDHHTVAAIGSEACREIH